MDVALLEFTCSGEFRPQVRPLPTSSRQRAAECGPCFRVDGDQQGGVCSVGVSGRSGHTYGMRRFPTISQVFAGKDYQDSLKSDDQTENQALGIEHSKTKEFLSKHFVFDCS